MGPRTRRAPDGACASIERHLRQGHYRTGTALPSVQSLARQLDRSEKAVLRALRGLARDGLVHRAGPAWLVGPSLASGPTRRMTDAPLIYVILRKSTDWIGLAEPRTAAFCRAFTDEARRHDVHIRLVWTEEGRVAPGNYPRGLEQAVEAARRQDRRYRGSLIAAGGPALPRFTDWASSFCGLGKPVVWLDRNDQGSPDGFTDSLFTRCRLSERRAVAAAVNHLVNRGHGKAVFVGSSATQWHVERANLIRSYIEESALPIECAVCMVTDEDHREGTRRFTESLRKATAGACAITAGKARSYLEHSPDIEGKIWSLEPDPSTYNRLRALAGWDESRLESYADHLSVLFSYPFFERCFDNFRDHVFILPNDLAATRFCYWVDMTGMVLGRDISAITFDNYPSHYLTPIDSVDLGFGYLGFTAFHAIAGDIPINPDTEGIVVSRPYVSDRGSVRDFSADLQGEA